MTNAWPWWLALMLAAALSPGVAAGAAGDPVAGKRKATPCNGCHAVGAFKAMPRLGGQSAAYIVGALRAYETHVRHHRTMQDVARGLSARDQADLAAFYASLPRASSEQAPLGAPAKARDCAVCHGEAGDRPAAADVPLLAGQSAGFLDQALREYRSGERVHAVMQEQARMLTDEELAALVQWYAQLPGLIVK
jgi:cytochrome c553